MSNISLIKEMYDTIAQADMQKFKSLLTDDIDWLSVGSPQDFPFAGHKNGSQAVVESFQVVETLVEMLDFTQYEFIALGETVVVLGSEKVRVKATGKEWYTDWVHIYTIENGKIARQREFFDTAAIAAAFKGN